MPKIQAPTLEDGPRFVSLEWIAQRWTCSRTTAKRFLVGVGAQPLKLGGDARNATVRFAIEDVLRVESSAASKIPVDAPAPPS